MALLEIACFSPEDAVLAAAAGADRIELCNNPGAGGTTPTSAGLLHVKANVSVPVHVMIRPRGGDFDYSRAEFDQMKHDLCRFKPEADGFVFGLLTAERRVDVQRTKELVNLAHPLPCTFHRAFDETFDPLEACESVIASGCKAILTSGCEPSAVHGLDVLSKICHAYGHRIVIMPGGGVRSSNLSLLRTNTTAQAFHSSATLHSGKPDADEILRMKSILREGAPGRQSDLKPGTHSRLAGPSARDEEDRKTYAGSIGSSALLTDRDC